MKRVLYKTIACLLIPSLVLAQLPPYRANESVKQTDLTRVWDALNTEVGQQIVSYIETTVGSINLEQAKAFNTAEGELAFVPIKSFSKVLAALCYRQLTDGSEYLFLITHNTAEKGVAFTFPSGRAFSMNSSGTKESFNPDFQFQEYDDLDNKVGMTDVNFLISILRGICEPARIIALVAGLIGFILLGFYFCDTFTRCNRFLYFMSYSVPFLLIAPAYLYENLNLEIISILFAVYYYGCSLLFDFRIIVP